MNLKKKVIILLTGLFLPLLFISAGAQRKNQEISPTDTFPAYIRQITSFGQRCDWSHDGKKLIFLEKTYHE